MKIDHNLPLTQNAWTDKSKSQGQKSVGFEEALSKASAKTAVTDVAGGAALAGLSSLSGALAAAQAGPAGRIERGLEVLDKYGQALADPAVGLEQIAPMVDELEKWAGNLEQLGQGLADGHGLKDVTRDTAVLMRVEAAKFRRGDFA